MELVNEYGADAIRLYMINSPLVRAEALNFKKEGVSLTFHLQNPLFSLQPFCVDHQRTPSPPDEEF